MKSSSKTRYTIRDVDRDLDRAVKEEAAHYGLSLNKTVLGLLAEAVGLKKADSTVAKADKAPPLVFEAWKDEEVKAMEGHLAASRKVDPKLWKGD